MLIRKVKKEGCKGGAPTALVHKAFIHKCLRERGTYCAGYKEHIFAFTPRIKGIKAPYPLLAFCIISLAGNLRIKLFRDLLAVCSDLFCSVAYVLYSK